MTLNGKILTISAHPDDWELGCGGTIERLKREGREVCHAVLGDGRGAITYKAVITAARPTPDCCVKEIYSFEVLSSTEWAFPTSFSPDVFVEITEKDTIAQMDCMK